jgi:hypothetical protein
MIDWAILPERLRNYIPFLLDVLSGRFKTPFLQRYKNHIKNLKDYGTDMTRSGYYGPRRGSKGAASAGSSGRFNGCPFYS